LIDLACNYQGVADGMWMVTNVAKWL